ncbi:MAG: deoxyribonuclease IV [bacterium]|nr:deoxyribonuclease IV [bacterium]
MHTGGLLVGAHMSVAGGLEHAITAAVACGFNCMQLFTHSPRVWEAVLANGEECEHFRMLRRAHRIRFVSVHAPYLPNLATPDDKLWERSLATIRRDVKVSEAIGADVYVMHPGSRKGSSVKEAVRRVGEALKQLCEGGVPKVQLVLETTSGGGTMLGGRLEELAEIITIAEGSVPGLRCGVCIDTAHVFAAGWDVRRATGVASLMEGLRGTVGVNRLRMVHANDSMHGHGTGRDQHAHIGIGKIGLEGFRELMKVALLRRVPWILETPKDDEGADVRNRMALERVYHSTRRHVR